MVCVDFVDDEVLKENVIYIINFGEVVKDLIEWNFVENFCFVFLIGDFLDFLIFSGIIIDV